MMSVLITTPDLGKPGGVAAYYAMLREYLPDDVHFCRTGARGTRGAFLANGLRLLQDYRRFYRMLRRGHYRLVHLNPSLRRKALLRDGLSLLLARAAGARVLVFLHGWDPACESSIRRRFLFLFRWVYFRADAFIVLASRFQGVLREWGYDKPIHVTTTAVPDEVFLQVVGREVRAPSPVRSLNILFLSRVEKAKGIYEAVEAFYLLHARYPRTTLAEGIRLVGWVAGEEKHQAFARADVYLFPSWDEGLPISVLEAMAHGLPVITRPVGGLPDFFEPGRMGFLTESHEPEVFASLLERLAWDERLRNQMGDYNRRYAMNRFRASQVARRLDEIYQAVAGGSRPAANAGGRTESSEDRPSRPCQRRSQPRSDPS
jgi:glycosyltransferase involved in cell wall biosynthesis